MYTLAFIPAFLLVSLQALPQVSQDDGIDHIDPLCANDGIQELDGDPNGGTWGGAADPLGYFDPAFGASGSPYLVTYTWSIGGGQTEVDSAWIVVSDPPTVTTDPAGPFCANAGAQQLNASPPGGWWDGEFGSVSPFGLFNPVFGSAFSPYAVWYTYADTNGCVGADTSWITIHGIPVVDVIDALTLCSGEPADTLYSWPTGGYWTGAADSAGVFDPALGPGTYQAVFTYTDSNACSASSQTTITVLDQVQGQLSDPGPLCVNDAPLFIWASPFFGTYGGAADSLGYVHPNALLPGEHLVTYTYQCTNCCPTVDSLMIVVRGGPQPTLLSEVICAEMDTVLLTAFPPGGSWSGSAGPDGLVTPVTLGVGRFPVGYQYTDSFGCSGFVSDSITILPSPALLWTLGGPYCSGEAADTLSAIPAGGTWGGAVDSAGIFMPSTAGAFLVTYGYHDSLTCYGELSDSLIVNQSPLVTIQPAGPFCDNGDPDQLSATPSGGSWISGANASGSFDPTTSGTGMVEVVYVFVSPEGCVGADVFDVQVIAVPEVTFGDNGPYCMNSGLHQLTAFPANGIWGGNALPDGEFSSQRPAGVYMISYRIDTVVCTTTGIDSVQVDDCTFIPENSTRDLELFPNPASDRVVIIAPENGNIRSILVLDRLGRVVASPEPLVSAGRIDLSVRDLAVGTYVILLETGDQRYRSQLQILH